MHQRVPCTNVAFVALPNSASACVAPRFRWRRILTVVAPLLACGADRARGEPPVAADSVPELSRVQAAVERVVAAVSPSVVGIRVERRYRTPAAEPVGAQPATQEQVVVVNGAGTIIDADGLILTNEHVVQSAQSIEVNFSDGSRSRATVRSADPRSDLAVLEVPRRGLRPAAFGDTRKLARGQWTIAMGNPYGLGADGSACVSIGVIANLGRRLPGLGAVDDRLYGDMIQTTAVINPGNSGGPLFNIAGELIGVVAAMHMRAALDDGVGFAIPLSATKRRIIERLREGLPVEYGYVGLSVRDPTPDERRAAGVSSGGAVVEQVESGGPAERASVRIGDLVASFAGQRIEDASHLVDLVGEASAGEKANVELRRGRQTVQIELSVERRDVSRVAWMRGGAVLWRGLRLADLTPETGSRLEVAGRDGVVVLDVVENSPASRAGIRIGDVLEAVNGQRVVDVAQFREAVRVEKAAVRIVVRARGSVEVGP
ncbi:MAG: trypsin-like peptidase domain-containing protein [Phycisphaerae bacterium]|jgi:serine protease Do